MMHTAFKTWDAKEESLQSIERRIHDGVADEQLHARAQGYVTHLMQNFPWSVPKPGAHILEVGSGVGYIMEAMARQFNPARITGLDVALHMIEHAKRRLARDGIQDNRFGFVHYDGIHVPLPDSSLDYIYSVACLQHIPKPFVYNLFHELHRLVKPRGFVALHFLSFTALPIQIQSEPFSREVERQLHNREGHWHHFYSFDELFHVLSDGVGVDLLDIQDDGEGAIWTCFSKGADRKYYQDDLPAGLSAARYRNARDPVPAPGFSFKSLLRHFGGYSSKKA